MGKVQNKLLVGIDVSKYKERIRSNDNFPPYDHKFVPYVEGHIGYDMQIIDDSENEHFLYFGKVLAYGSVKAEAEIANFEMISEEVKCEYEKLFDEEISLKDIKMISCSLVW